MAIKRGSKVDKSFSSASMTDLIFLLLLFMLIATTLINPWRYTARVQAKVLSEPPGEYVGNDETQRN